MNKVAGLEEEQCWPVFFEAVLTAGRGGELQPLLQDLTEELLLLHLHAHQRVEEELRAGDVHHCTNREQKDKPVSNTSLKVGGQMQNQLVEAPSYLQWLWH